MKIKALFLLPMLLLFFGCSGDNDATPVKETVKSVTYEVLLFEFTADTGNNSSRLRYNIKHSNPNKFAVKGSSKITLNYDGLIVSSFNRIDIAANSNFTESYDAEEPFNINLGKRNSIKLVSVEYIFAD